MKIIKSNGFELSADTGKTEKYYRLNTLCNCSECRNFYVQINEKLPELQAFLSGFGVNAARPDELSYYIRENEVIYDAMYTVTGKIKKPGSEKIAVGSISLTIGTAYVPNEQTEPYFVITAHDIQLPWLLNEEP